MDALQEARQVMQATEQDTGVDADDLVWMFAQAQAYAAIAQAEHLKRIAASLEIIVKDAVWSKPK